MSIEKMSNEEVCNLAWQTKSVDELKAEYTHMKERLDARRATCRKSSKQYYAKKYKLDEDATIEQITQQKVILEKRDKYQASYYEKNKEDIRKKQKAYREKRKKALLKKEKEDYLNMENHDPLHAVVG